MRTRHSFFLATRPTRCLSILVFTTLFQDVCQKFNISVPILGSDDGSHGANGTPSPAGNSTNTTNDSSSFSAVPSPFVGSANGFHGSNRAAWTSLAGLVVLVTLGLLL
jgi:hypothetical protein